MNIQNFVDFKNKITGNVSHIIVGKEDVIEQVIVCLLASGHVLLEDVPGTGKTMLLRAFAKSIGGEFRRIQFTPDLLPSDLTGIHFFDQKQGDFIFRKGPLFSNVVLADEINRAVPRSQSALLEVMEEKQISVDGETFPMGEPYMVMATQNPVENYGTFPLPEAQLDRFFMRLSLGYMSRSQELSVLTREDTQELLGELTEVVTPEEVLALRKQVNEVKLSDEVAGYLMDIVEATRRSELLTVGVSTRGALALTKAARIEAALSGRDFVIPEDVKKEALVVLPHRITLVSRSHMNPVNFIEKLIADIEVPLEKL